MMRRRRRTPVPVYPGYSGDVITAADFARCGNGRRMAILGSLTRLMELYTRNLERADERLAEAARAVAIEHEQIAEERLFLASVMNTYVEFSKVIAADAASAIEAASAGETTQIGSTEGESAAPQEDAQTPSDTPKGSPDELGRDG